jgi:hypothetical protein
VNEFRAALPAWAVPALASAAYAAITVQMTTVFLGEDPSLGALLVAGAALQVAAGLAVGRWWALALATVPVLAAYGLASEPESCDGFCFPAWLAVLLFMGVLGLPLLAAGVAARKLLRPAGERPAPSARTFAALGAMLDLLALATALSDSWFVLVAPAVGVAGAVLGIAARRRAVRGSGIQRAAEAVALLGFLPLALLAWRYFGLSR